jgi:hypothetical protein
LVHYQENVYWVFSSAAQTVAAFVAFLLAGYALVHSMMDNLERADETLAEIHIKLKTDYYRRVRLLSIVTASAILLSLFTVYLNGRPVPYFDILVGISGILTASAIIGGVWFVLVIIDPAKYQKTARKLIAEEPHLLGVEAAVGEFFQSFVELERVIRALWEGRGFPSLTTRA